MEFLSPSLAFIEGLGGPEMVLIFVIVLVLFGGEKLPDFARGLGKSIREFKKAASGVEEEFKRALEEDAHKKSAPPPPPATFPAYPPTSTPPALAEPSIDESAEPALTDDKIVETPATPSTVEPAPASAPAPTEPPAPTAASHLP
jgi:sec-independent protein translocase protein TatA